MKYNLQDPIATCDSMATDDTGNNNHNAYFLKEAKFQNNKLRYS